MSWAATDIGYLVIVLVGHEVGEQADHGPVNAVGREHLQDVVGVLPRRPGRSCRGWSAGARHRSPEQGIGRHRHRQSHAGSQIAES